MEIKIHNIERGEKARSTVETHDENAASSSQEQREKKLEESSPTQAQKKSLEQTLQQWHEAKASCLALLSPEQWYRFSSEQQTQYEKTVQGWIQWARGSRDQFLEKCSAIEQEQKIKESKKKLKTHLKMPLLLGLLFNGGLMALGFEETRYLDFIEILLNGYLGIWMAVLISEQLREQKEVKKRRGEFIEQWREENVYKELERDTTDNKNLQWLWHSAIGARELDQRLKTVKRRFKSRQAMWGYCTEAVQKLSARQERAVDFAWRALGPQKPQDWNEEKMDLWIQEVVEKCTEDQFKLLESESAKEQKACI